MMRTFTSSAGAVLTLLSAASCTTGQSPAGATPEGIALPTGFHATTFADQLGRGRHVIVRENGDVYVSLDARSDKGGGIVALRDTNADGVADEIRCFGEVSGTGLDLHDGYLYFGENSRIVRFKFDSPTELVPSGPLEIVVDGFPRSGGHAAKPVTFDRSGHLYVNIGVPTNACQDPDRSPGVPGRQPCPDLVGHGIYMYGAAKLNQRHPQDGTHFATGLRQTVALEWNAHVGQLYLVMHGRDQLNLFPKYYSDQDSAEMPAEEMHLVKQGLDAGWPYTYWDGRRKVRMVAPEYGGDGRKEAEAGRYATPIVAFPAHWAPNDLVFYDSDRWPGGFAKDARPFPERYQHGAFIAFHGSWNRAPLPQQGYKVVFQAFDGEQPKGDYEEFATGFAGVDPIRSPGHARYRPCGVAVAPDGALFVVDSEKGRVWRITYTGH